MKVTLLETFDNKLKLILPDGIHEFETTKQLLDFEEEKGVRAEITFCRKSIPESAVICYSPASDWTEVKYNFNWWRTPYPVNKIMKARRDAKVYERDSSKD